MTAVTVGVTNETFLGVSVLDLTVLLVIYKRNIPEITAARIVERAVMRATVTSLPIPYFPVFSFSFICSASSSTRVYVYRYIEYSISIERLFQYTIYFHMSGVASA